MKESIKEIIKLPENYSYEIKEDLIKIIHSGQMLQKRFSVKNIHIKGENNEIIIESDKSSKRELKMINTIYAHIMNMINGLKEKYEYKLEVVYLHFPVTLEYNKDKNEILIKNFLGEKKPRLCKLVKGCEVEINKNSIIIRSSDKNVAGQSAANLERATHIRNRDRRKFQDGIFIVEKCGRAI